MGEVGYIYANIRDLIQAKIGDTVTHPDRPTLDPYPGFMEVKPMVFAGLFPVVSEDYEDLRDAVDKLRLNDASFSFEPRAVTFNADYAHWMQWEPAYRSMIFVQEAQDTDFRQWPEAMAFEMVVLVDSIVDPFARERGTRIYGCSLPKRPIRETVLNGPWR